MSVSLLQADAIFDGKSFLPKNTVLIVHENGTLLDIRPLKSEDENVQIFRGILTPGWINTHCHLELSHLKSAIQPHTGMVGFLLSVVKSRKASEELIFQQAQIWADQMYQKGISVVGDICNTSAILQIASKSPLKFYHFVEAIGFNPAQASARFENALQIQKQYQTINPSAVVPHAPYSVSQLLYELIDGQSDDKIISIHHAESKAEQDFFQKSHSDFDELHQFIQTDLSKHTIDPDTTSIRSFLPKFHHKKILLVHNVTITESDLQYIQEMEVKNNLKIYFSICIRANQYIGNGYPDLELIMKYFPDRITIGTDSLASNDDLDLMHEFKLLMELFPSITIEQWLKMVTAQGANALGFGEDFGYLQIGTKPGIVQIQMNDFTSNRIF